MKELFKTKEGLQIKETPIPHCNPNEILIKNKFSILYHNVEKDFLSKSGSIVKKVLKKRELLNQVIKKTLQDGPLSTYKLGKAMMSSWHTLGSCTIGEVIKKGHNVKNYKEGDLVITSGWYYANHAEIICIDQKKIAKLPKNVNLEFACLAAYGAKIISVLTYLKLKNEKISILGDNTGSILLKKILEAKDFKITSLENANIIFNPHRKITEEEIVELNKTKSKLIIFSEKDLNIRDLNIEQETIRLFASERKYQKETNKLKLVEELNQKDLEEFFKLTKPEDFINILDRAIELKDLPNEYTKLQEYKNTIIKYKEPSEEKTFKYFNTIKNPEDLCIALVGVGAVAKSIYMPLIENSNCFVKYCLSKSGRTAAGFCHHYQIPYATSDYEEILNDPSVDIILILSHHSSHANFVSKALEKGKHVLVEKPLAISKEQLEAIKENKEAVFTIGFNRNFSPYTEKIKETLKARKHPLLITHRIQSKLNTKKPWLYNPEISGGRIIGEYCHLINFALNITNSKVKVIKTTSINSKDEFLTKDANLIITLTFEDGSIANLIGTEDGDQSFNKERMEIICDNKIITITDWEEMTINGNKIKLGPQKGHKEHWNNFISTIKGKKKPLNTLNKARETTEISFKANTQTF